MATTVQNPFDTQQGSAANQPTPAGLVASSLPAQNTVTTYSPQTRQVNQPTETVQGQVTSILAKDSPLMQRARTIAAQGMAQRGLVNSSMAQGAGVAAMTDRALPMAQQDANTYSSTAAENMNAQNRAAEFGAGAANQFGVQRSDQAFTAGENAANRGFTTSERLGSQSFTSNLETAKQNFAASQADLERAQQTDITKLQQNFAASQSDLDRAQQMDITKLQQNFAASQSQLDRAQQAYLQDRSAENQMTLQAAQQNFAGSQAQLDRAQQAFIQKDQQAFQTSMTQMQQSFTAAQSSLDRQQQAYLQKDAQDFQKNLTNSQIPTNFALAISNTASNSINAIAADPNLSGTVDSSGTSPKSRAIQSVINYSNSQIEWANKFYGTTIPGLPTA